MTVDDVGADEIWGFVGCKEKTPHSPKGRSERKGRCLDCGIAVERFANLCSPGTLASALLAMPLSLLRNFAMQPSRFQLSTDGLRLIRLVPMAFEDGEGIGPGQLVETYGTPSGKSAEFATPQGDNKHLGRFAWVILT